MAFYGKNKTVSLDLVVADHRRSLPLDHYCVRPQATVRDNRRQVVDMDYVVDPWPVMTAVVRSLTGQAEMAVIA